jgi:hypothetical protein
VRSLWTTIRVATRGERFIEQDRHRHTPGVGPQGRPPATDAKQALTLELGVGLTTGRQSTGLPVHSTPLVIAPSKRKRAATEVGSVLGAESDIGQDTDDRERWIFRIRPTAESALWRINDHCSGPITHDARRGQCAVGHDNAARRLATASSRLAILSGWAASRSRIRSSSRSRRECSLATRRWCSSPSRDRMARTKARCASVARGSSRRRAIVEYDEFASRNSSACSSRLRAGTLRPARLGCSGRALCAFGRSRSLRLGTVAPVVYRRRFETTHLVRQRRDGCHFALPAEAMTLRAS